MKSPMKVLVLILCLALVLCAAGCNKDDVAPVISGVSSSGITGSGATIAFATDEKATTQVEYGTTTGYGSLTDVDKTQVTSHSVSLEGLAANTTYHYRVKTTDAAGNEAVSDDFSFTTPQPVTAVALNKSSTTIVKGLSEQLTATVQPPNATNAAVTWASTDNRVATVSTTGLVTAVDTGTSVVTVTTVDQGKTAICAVTVIPEGQSPALAVGNKWVYELTDNGTYYTYTLEITGDGKVGSQDCWVIQNSWTPDFRGMSTATERASKATLNDLQVQFTMNMGMYSATASIVFSYAPADASLFPMEVGKQFQVTETRTTTATVLTQTQTETETVLHTYKVEAVEQVTVKAGTFKCFKITDTTSEGVDTIWYSDQVKGQVKSVGSDGSTQELQSYLV